MIALTPEQKTRITQYIEKFKGYEKSDDFKKDVENRREREKLFSKFDKDKIKSISEFEFGELVSNLWASQIWGNKEYLVQRFILENGIDKIRREFESLLFGTDTIEHRFDKLDIKYLGSASITEILCLFNPKEFGIWNDKARKALKMLGFDKVLPLDKYRISGNEYKNFNELLKIISGELIANGFRESDLLFVDYFLYEIEESGEYKEPIKKTDTSFDHDEVRDYVRNIGLSLGFEAEIEKTIGHGARIDVIWRAKISNLGIVNYVFEVQRSGSIDSLLINLQKAKRNPSVQKVIIVSDPQQLDKIELESKGLPEEFRKSLSFWNAFEVKAIHESLAEVKRNIDRLNLVKGEFEIE